MTLRILLRAVSALTQQAQTEQSAAEQEAGHGLGHAAALLERIDDLRNTRRAIGSGSHVDVLGNRNRVRCREEDHIVK